MTLPGTREEVAPHLTRTAGVAVSDLFLDAAQVAAHLRQAVDVGDWTDAYLFAAGLSQLVDDDLHPDPASLRRAAAFLRSNGSRAATAAAYALSAGAGGLGAVTGMGRRRELWRRSAPLRALVDVLAGVVIDPATAPGLEARIRRLRDRCAGIGELVPDDVLRLPAAFRSFDQHPDDIDRLAGLTLRRHLRAAVPVSVVGVRTSGSYLAPLFAAALRHRGVPHVEVLTHRPQRAFLHDEVEQLQRVCGAGGRVVIIDDPPGSGSSIAATASAVGRTGVADEAIVVAVCVFPDADPLPARLDRWASVTLPWNAWAVHERLTEPAVGRALAGLVGPRQIVAGVRRTDDGKTAPRRHVQAQFCVTLCEPDGRRQDRAVLVEGVGLGWFGRHAIAVNDALLGWTPRVFGVADGLLFSEATSTEVPAAEPFAAAQLAAYCAYRHETLPARRDPTALMRGRDPVWEVAAALLAGMFGRLGPLARPLLLEPLTRRLLRVDEPSVVDGDTGLPRWRFDPAGRRLVKLAPHDRAFSHLEGACYDPVFDLAGAATDPSAPEFEASLRAEYERISGAAVRAEAWLLYRLVHLWRLGRAKDVDATVIARGSAVAVTQYLAGIHLVDVGASDGPLCPLDLDGVLESDPLGFPVTTPAGTLALRALIRHGYRPVLATGRSVADARELCRVLGLAGAVAEYGTVAYVRDGDRTVDLRTPAQRALIERAREELDRSQGIDLDPRHQHAIRARTNAGPLRPDQLAPVVRGADVRVVQGQAQTDLTVAGLDKASGLQALGQLLGGDPTCALAVGDGSADVTMLAAACVARAPANAAEEIRAAGVTVVRRAYQAGLADAVADLLGHAPGTCATCRAPRVSAAGAPLLAVLALREDGIGGLAPRTARLALAVARSAVTTRW